MAQLLHNPLKEDFTFRWDKVPYVIKAGATENFQQDFLALHGAKHLCDYILLRPSLWPELGIKRLDDGSQIKEIDGQKTVVNEPIWTQNREPVLDIILCRVPAKVQEKEDMEAIEKAKIKLSKKASETEAAFEDLKNIK